MKKLLYIIFGLTLLTFTSCKDQTRDRDCIDRSKINLERQCNFDYSPVCGCDGKTYKNECDAKRNGVTRYTIGECKQGDNNVDCIDRSKIRSGIVCPTDIDLVCGCDGKTYNNDCEAKKNGVTRYTKGECDKKEESENDKCNDVVPNDELCLAQFNRWFYIKDKNQCELITYSGCNRKGFETKSDCEQCKNNR